MNFKKIIIVTLMGSGIALAQDAPVPDMTVTEKIAIQTILNQKKDLDAEFMQVMADVAKTHPGYHVNMQAVLTLEKDPPAHIVKPAVKK